MKKIAIIVAGLAVLAGTAYLGSRLGAQPNTAGPGSAGPTSAATRIAFINIDKVFLEYKKAGLFRKELEVQIEPKRVQHQTLAKAMISKKTDMDKPGISPRDREALGKDIIAYQRQMEDIDRDVQQSIGARSDQISIQLYRDLQENVQKYAAANNFQAVLAYREPSQQDPLNMLGLIRRDQAMKIGSSTGLVVPPGLDISAAVVNLMNQNYDAAAGTPAQGPPASPPKQ